MVSNLLLLAGTYDIISNGIVKYFYLVDLADLKINLFTCNNNDISKVRHNFLLLEPPSNPRRFFSQSKDESVYSNKLNPGNVVNCKTSDIAELQNVDVSSLNKNGKDIEHYLRRIKSYLSIRYWLIKNKKKFEFNKKLYFSKLFYIVYINSIA